MEIVVTNERTSKRGFDCSTRIIHKLKELFGQTKTTKQEETDKHQSRKVDHFANRSICFCGIPCVEIIKRAGHVVKERFIDARVQETSCNSTEIGASSFPDTFNFKDPNKIYQTKACVEKIAPAPSVKTFQSLERREGSHEDETSPKSTPTCNQKLGLDSNDMSPVEVSDVLKKNKASFPYGKSSAEIDVLPFPDTFNCKDVNKIYQTKVPVEMIAPAPSIRNFQSLEKTEDSHEDETSLKSTHTCSQRLRMDSLMSDSTHCTFNSNEHSLTCLKTVYEPAVVTSDGHQNMSFEEIGPGEGQFEGLHQMQFANHLKDVNDCEYGICTELDCPYLKELSLSYPDLTTETSECYSKSFECSDGCNFLLVSTSIISDTSNGSVYESVPDTSNNSDDESIHVKFLQNGTLNHIHDITLDSDDQENSNSKAVEENCGTIENTNPDVKQEISKETSSDPSSDIQIDNSEHIFPLISNIEIICLIFYYMYIFMRLVEGYYVLGEPIEHSSLNENSTTDFIIQTLIRAENNLDILVYYMLQIMKRLQMSKVYNSNEDENLIIPCRNQSEFSVTEIKVDSLKEISSKVDNFDTFRDPRGMLNIAVKDGKCSEKQQSVDLSETLALCCLFQYCIMVLLIELHKDKLGEGIDKEEENFSIIDEHKLTDSQEDVIIGSILRIVKHGSSTENHMKSQKVMLPDTDKIRNDSFKVHSEHKKNSFESNNSTSSWNKRVKDKRRKRKRKCKRFKKNTCTLKPESQSINNSNHVNNINSKCSKEDRPNQKENSFAKDFCHKCHHYKVNANVCCSECRCELNSIKYQCQVRSREDSGIASCLSSLRSSILLEFDQLQPFHSTKQNSKTRNRSLRKFLKLGLLGQDLRRITKEVNSRALANIERDGVVLPWLQSYFDSLRNGITPSLQEQMVYEWLRLLSFSSYTGGGSPVHLARSGFYLHHGNETHCYSCDASYSTWSYTDNVDEIHRRISPNCPFINGGLASSGNISIDSERQDNQSSLSAQNSGRQENLSSQSTQSQARSQLPHHGRDTTNQPAPEGLYSFRPNMGSFQGGIPSATASATNISPAFSFYPSSTVNSPPGLSFSQLPSASSRPTGRVYSLAEVTNQLGALTLQQQVRPYTWVKVLRVIPELRI